jgi:predicted permease
MADEIQVHIDSRAEHLMRSGMSREDAERRARIELGGRETFKEECRRSYGFGFIDELLQDVRYARRMLRKSPAFTVVAIVSLALGIGANTVVFSVMNTLLLKPLPVPSPKNLYFVEANHFPAQSYPNYRDIRDRNSAFSGVAATRITPVGLEAGDGAHRVWSYLVTGNYFDVLGIKPAAGRFFRPDEDVKEGANPYVVLSYGTWMQRFGGDPGVPGKSIRIDGQPFTIVGVAPKGFHGTEVFFWPEVYLPISMQRQLESFAWLNERSAHNIWVIGRVKDGITVHQAEANLATVAAGLHREYPSVNEHLELTLARPGLGGDFLRKPAQAFLSSVMLLAGIVLLAGCANLASLLAARAADRSRELAIRISIGAGKARILRQLATESVAIAVLGGAAACALAAAVVRALNAVSFPLDFPGRLEFEFDVRVLAFAFAVSLLTGLLFGVAPARHALAADPNETIRGSSGTPARARRWAFRDVLVGLQVALCCTVIVASVVSVRGMQSALSAHLGFEPRGVSMVAFDLALAHYKPADAIAFRKRALDAAARIPGVTAAGLTGAIPLGADQSDNLTFREDETDQRPSNGVDTAYYNVSPGFFEVMRTRLLEGRTFVTSDEQNSRPLMVVNETLCRKLFGTPHGVGRRFRTLGGGVVAEVVGVVEDGKYVTITEQPRAAMFRIARDDDNSTILLVRSTRPELQVASELREEIRRMDPSLPLYQTGSAEQMLGFAMLPARAAAVALSAFGVLAVMLSVTGIYGLAAYSVSRRLREIGIRMAVGARPANVLRFVLGRITVMLAFGSAAGLGLGVAADRLLANIVYQASSRDPIVIGISVGLMGAVALLAASGPARKAVTIDPVRALRVE